MKEKKCEECLNLDFDVAIGKAVGICSFSTGMKCPIYENKKTEDYLWCEGRGFREQSK